MKTFLKTMGVVLVGCFMLLAFNSQALAVGVDSSSTEPGLGCVDGQGNPLGTFQYVQENPYRGVLTLTGVQGGDTTWEVHYDGTVQQEGGCNCQGIFPGDTGTPGTSSYFGNMTNDQWIGTPPNPGVTPASVRGTCLTQAEGFFSTTDPQSPCDTAGYYEIVGVGTIRKDEVGPNTHTAEVLIRRLVEVP